MYRQLFSTRKTKQTDQIPGKIMVKNSAGGYAFAVDDWDRFKRFLILGSESNTYYASAQTLTKENAMAAMRCIDKDGKRAVNLIKTISESGKAPKNDPALFSLAMASAADDLATRRMALDALPAVARIGTHLFQFLEYVEGFRGWGRALREAVRGWYNKPVDNLAYQVIKYRQRGGWSHRDVLRLAHPKTADPKLNALYRYITQNDFSEVEAPFILGFEQAKTAETETAIIKLIHDYGLTREMIPTKWLNSAAVWEALLDKMPMTAMIRNLGKMSNVGLLGPLSLSEALICQVLGDSGRLKKSRIHPLAVLIALKTYQNGQGLKGSLSWRPSQPIIDALNEAFYITFDHIEPTNKNTLLALDVSSSMDFGNIAGMPLRPREAAAAMVMVTARTEQNKHIMAFSHNLANFNVSPKQRLDDVIRAADHMRMGGTDCALPMLEAAKNKWPIETFVIYTDNETWAGEIHPVQALEQYRQTMGIRAKLIVIGMTSNGFSIADPSDSNMLDIVGFDTAAPQVISNFSKR